MQSWVDRNLRYIAILVPTAVTVVQTMAQVFGWRLPWNSRLFAIVTGIFYIAVFWILYRRTPLLRHAVRKIFLRSTTWLLIVHALVLLWLILLTRVVFALLGAAPAGSQVAEVPSHTPTPTLPHSTPTSSSNPTFTPAPYLTDAFNEVVATGGTWETIACLPGAVSHRFDRIHIAVTSNEIGPELSCILHARLRSATPQRAVVRLTIQESTSDLAFAGIISSCGGPYANLLLTPGSVLISRSGEQQQDLVFYSDLPVTKTIQIEWLEGFMRFSVIEDDVSSELPCSQKADYVRIGAFATSGGKVVVDFLEFSLWASTATPTP